MFVVEDILQRLRERFAVVQFRIVREFGGDLRSVGELVEVGANRLGIRSGRPFFEGRERLLDDRGLASRSPDVEAVRQPLDPLFEIGPVRDVDRHLVPPPEPQR